jgi:hypothetical protein
VFADIAGTRSLFARVEGYPLFGELVTANYFRMLGVSAGAGRTFLPQDGGSPGAAPVVVLSYAAWQNKLGGDPDIVGKTLVIRGYPLQVIGIMQPEFTGLDTTPRDFWVPITMAGPLEDGPNLFGADQPARLDIIGRLTMTPTPTEVWIWALYNFLVFAVAPYVYFRRRYTSTALNLRSTDRRNDVRLMVIVLALESAFELSAFHDILGLTPRQLLLGAPLSFGIFFIGTVLPTMVLIYAILLPRYLKLTRSAISTVLLGGLTYAAMHLVEGWSAFDSPRDITLSLLFVLFQYFGPGMMKSVLTLRTGNAWVHALGYHAVAPHVIVDTPLVVKVFGIV